jgi:prepilin-type N-terminal cleavage/methylation domain-containing protein
MKSLMKKQLKGRKGFTLVEVIVVLVILAILAALAIPALTGYIDKANERAVKSDTRIALVAMQTYVSDQYGEGVTSGAFDATTTIAGIVNGLSGTTYKEDNFAPTTIKAANVVSGNTINTFAFKNNDYICTYSAVEPHYTTAKR